LGLFAVAALATAGSASAHEGEYARFNQCPSTNASVFKCINSLTEGGKVVLGKKTVPIVNPVTLQGGFGKPDAETGMSAFFGAANGETLSKAPQPVPGGLAGLVNCKEISNLIIRVACEVTFENGLTGVNSTLELAKPASEIKISEANLARQEGVALELPVKVHLENPFLGSECYVGSSSSPLLWKLTTGATSPPPPNVSISGASGEVEFLEEGRIGKINKSKLVDNAWSAPQAHGCGGALFEWAVNPLINLEVGLPSAAGKNAAILETTSYLATAKAVNAH
jgi:hypothetical protein